MKFVFSILFLALTISANAQVCEAVLEQSSMLIGERNQLNITISQYPKKVVLPAKIKIKGVVANKKTKKSDTLLLEISKITQDSTVSNQLQKIHIAFTLWDTGYVTILPITLDSINNIIAPPNLLHVAYPKVNLKGDIKDIKAGKVDLDAIVKKAEEKEGNMWLYISIGAAIAVLIAVILYFILRKKKAEVQPEVLLSLYEQTKLNLDELMLKKLWEKNEIKLHFIELTEIIRVYVGKNYTIDALEKTTNELKYLLKSMNVANDHIDLLINLLTASDLVKFAKQTMIPEEIIATNNKAYLLLDLTYKKPEIQGESNE